MAEGTDLWEMGLAALQAGRLAEAEDLLRQLLAAEPQRAEAWYGLGVTFQNQGRARDAVDCYGRALGLRPDYPEAHYNLANALRAEGHLEEAIACYRRALVLHPDFLEAHYNLGNTLRQIRRPAEAIECYARALRLGPDLAEAHNNMGNALRDLYRSAEAEVCFRRALELRPELPGVVLNLGTALLSQDRPADALEYFQKALQSWPQVPEVHLNLGIAFQQLGRREEAIDCFRRAVGLRPEFSDALRSLGIILLDDARAGEAAECFRSVLRMKPDDASACYHLASALRDQGRLAEAAETYVQSLRLRSGFVEALYNLGNVLREMGRPSEAERYLRRTAELQADFVEARIALGNVLVDQGRLDEAEVLYRKAMDDKPELIEAIDGLLLQLHYRPGVTPEEIRAAHANYDEQYGAPLRSHWQPHANDRDPDRPLRIGLVSPDFSRHPVGFLMVRAVEALARRPVVVLCYSDRRKPPDDLTTRFRAAASEWRDVAGLNADQLADRIRTDRVDILIDLAGHTAGNRLLMFARKAAPLQVTWLGYEGSTGLGAIDYLIADDCLVPMGAEDHYPERVLCLPGGYACYDPPAAAPEPGPLPAQATGRLTFGCFNNPAKLSGPALTAFAAVLQRVSGARLVLKYRGLDDPVIADRLRDRLTAADIEPGRVELRGGTDHASYLASCRDIDVALDPFPFNGGVTTCDALWMGVPVVTLPGATFASRHGLTYLTRLGLADELAGRDLDDYAARAAGLAQDVPRLSKLRDGLRDRMARSPLCDGDRLADELLTVLRGAWHEWVRGNAS